MKRTIIVVLMVVLVATPCLAQEVETDGLFSLDGTQWRGLPIGGYLLPIPLLPFPIFYFEGWQWGFYGGEVYPIVGGAATNSFYIDMMVASIFMYKDEIGTYTFGSGIVIGFGIMQPIGLGIVTVYIKYEGRPVPIIATGLVIKKDNNWSPPDVE
jgi:hypothetical protein